MCNRDVTSIWSGYDLTERWRSSLSKSATHFWQTAQASECHPERTIALMRMPQEHRTQMAVCLRDFTCDAGGRQYHHSGTFSMTIAEECQLEDLGECR